MKKTAWLLLLVCVSLSVTSCRKKSLNLEPRIPLSPRSIDLAGVTFYLTHEQLSGKLNMLRCSSSDPVVKKCRWNTTRGDREGIFKGIEEIEFTLYRDSVQTIAVYYSQLLDAEYDNFDKAVQQKYATLIGNLPPDTANIEWPYDSLIVKFMPNRRKHWTGSMHTYTPVLEFQERMLYKRWIDDVQRQKTDALY